MNDDPETEEQQEEGEVDNTPRTTSKKTTGTNSPGRDRAWVWDHLQKHAMAGTSPQKWVIDLAMGRFGGTPADYPQGKPRALLSDMNLEPLSLESLETNPSTANNAPHALPASNPTTTSSSNAAIQTTTSSSVAATQATTGSLTVPPAITNSTSPAVTNPGYTTSNPFAPRLTDSIFSTKTSDVPVSLQLTGGPSEDIPDIIQEFRSRKYSCTP